MELLTQAGIWRKEVRKSVKSGSPEVRKSERNSFILRVRGLLTFELFDSNNSIFLTFGLSDFRTFPNKCNICHYIVNQTNI